MELMPNGNVTFFIAMNLMNNNFKKERKKLKENTTLSTRRKSSELSNHQALPKHPSM
jgi:hypothetical protein